MSGRGGKLNRHSTMGVAKFKREMMFRAFFLFVIIIGPRDFSQVMLAEGVFRGIVFMVGGKGVVVESIANGLEVEICISFMGNVKGGVT